MSTEESIDQVFVHESSVEHTTEAHSTVETDEREDGDEVKAELFVRITPENIEELGE